LLELLQICGFFRCRGFSSAPHAGSVYYARRYSVDTNALRAQFDRESAYQSGHTVFRGDVAGQVAATA
jgi:hypothetical protein